jgi:hypothetical protein
MMCDVPSNVPSMAVFCKESIECYPGIVCSFFLISRNNSHGPSDYWYDKAFHVLYLLNFYTFIFIS